MSSWSDPKPILDWEVFASTKVHGVHPIQTKRLKVPGGWLVMVNQGNLNGLTFYPDPNHEWQIELKYPNETEADE